MGLFGRAGGQLKGWLKGLTHSAPDPRQTFVYTYQHQRDLLDKVQQALVDMGAAKERLQAKTDEVQKKLPQLEDQAMRALIAKREDLARIALQRRQVATVELQTLRDNVAEVEQEEHRLALVEQRLSTQIEAFFARQEVIAARYSAAEAQVRINEALGGVSTELADLGSQLEQAEQRAVNMQARASALDELVNTGVLEMPAVTRGDALDRNLAQIEVGKEVEGQLEEMKKKLKAGAGTTS